MAHVSSCVPSDPIEEARSAHRHAAHVLVRTKKTSPKYEEAVKNHERAAILLVAACAQKGLGL